MEIIGSFEAKTHLSALLRKVSEGEEIIISKHGVPVARLCPYQKNAKKSEITSIVEEIKKERKKHSLEGESIRDLIEEGRE
jgi:prevent-host-death family protein